jgi:hypothetical protein
LFTDFKDPPANSAVVTIYARLLEKPGLLAKVYIGSGTRTVHGVKARFKDYDRGDLPPLIQREVNEGYVVQQVGLVSKSSVSIPCQGNQLRTTFCGFYLNPQILCGVCRIRCVD